MHFHSFGSFLEDTVLRRAGGALIASAGGRAALFTVNIRNRTARAVYAWAAEAADQTVDALERRAGT